MITDTEDLSKPLPFKLTIKLPQVDYYNYGKGFSYYLQDTHSKFGDMYRLDIGQIFEHEPSYAIQSMLLLPISAAIYLDFGLLEQYTPF